MSNPSNFLEDYSNEIIAEPGHVRRLMKLLRDLDLVIIKILHQKAASIDEKWKSIQNQYIKELTESYQNGDNQAIFDSNSENVLLYKKIVELFEELKRIENQKVIIARQANCRIENQIERFEKEINSYKEFLNSSVPYEEDLIIYVFTSLFIRLHQTEDHVRNTQKNMKHLLIVCVITLEQMI